MERKPASAFITTRKGFFYLTIRSFRSNRHIMRIRNYTLDANDKRQMRRLHPDVVFDCVHRLRSGTPGIPRHSIELKGEISGSPGSRSAPIGTPEARQIFP